MSRLIAHVLSPGEEAALSKGNPKIIRDMLEKISLWEYIAVSRTGLGCSFEGYLDGLRRVGVDVGIDNSKYCFEEVAVDKDTKELRVFRNK